MKITGWKDYMEELYKEFPYILKSDIDMIVKHGCSQLAMINRYGGDIVFTNKYKRFIIGKIFHHLEDPTKEEIEKFQAYYLKKALVKARVMRKRKMIGLGTTYYFGVSKAQHLEMSKPRRGRPKKFYTLENLVLYNSLEEFLVLKPLYKHVYVVDLHMSYGNIRKVDSLQVDNLEYVGEFKTRNLKDVLWSNRTYDAK